jgi:hypothetical protein
VQPAALPSRSRKLLAATGEAIPFHYIVAGIVAAALLVALFAAFGLGRRLWTLSPGQPAGALPGGVLPGPLLLAMLGALVAMCVLSLFVRELAAGESPDHRLAPRLCAGENAQPLA